MNKPETFKGLIPGYIVGERFTLKPLLPELCLKTAINDMQAKFNLKSYEEWSDLKHEWCKSQGQSIVAKAFGTRDIEMFTTVDFLV